jgi:hypothetical protein
MKTVTVYLSILLFGAGGCNKLGATPAMRGGKKCQEIIQQQQKMKHHISDPQSLTTKLKRK